MKNKIILNSGIDKKTGNLYIDFVEVDEKMEALADIMINDGNVEFEQ